MDKTRNDMVTLPNGIQIPRSQYEQESGTIKKKKDSRGQVLEQTIG